MDHQFDKVLVARYSPENRCFASEGDILYPPLPEFKPDGKPRKKKYHFHSAFVPGVLSKYGWVKTADQPFTLREFAREYLPDQISEEELSVAGQLFFSISRLADATPVAGSFFDRPFEQRKLALTFHKVFFYPRETHHE